MTGRYIPVVLTVAITGAVFLLALFPPVLPSGFALHPKKAATTAVGKREHTPAERVIVYPPVLGAYLTVNEGADHVVAASEFARELLQEGLLAPIYPQARGIDVARTQGGNTAIPGDPEQLLAMEPDAILAWSWFAAPLKQFHLPVVEIGPQGTDPALIEFWRQAAAVSGKTARGEALVAGFLADYAQLGSELSDLPPRDRPRVLFLSRRQGSYVAARTSDDMNYLAAQYALDRSSAAQLSAEQLLALNPEVIFLPSTVSEDENPESYFSDPALQTLSAVKSRRIYRQPLGGARMEGLVERPLLLRWMAELLHPTEMPRRFREEFRDKYREVYGHSLGDEEIDRAIFVKENRLSADYRRFGRD